MGRMEIGWYISGHGQEGRELSCAGSDKEVLKQQDNLQRRRFVSKRQGAREKGTGEMSCRP